MHLTPEFFFAKKIHALAIIYSKKVFDFVKSLIFLCSVEVRKIILKSPPFWLTTVFSRARVW